MDLLALLARETAGHAVHVTSPRSEDEIRASALIWIERVTLGGNELVDRDALANDFTVDGERFPLVDRGRGIRKPKGWRAPLSIMTAAPKTGKARPYEDGEGPDGLQRYKLRRDDGGHIENEGLRTAMREQTPLIWFYGESPAKFNAIAPVYLTAEEYELDQFVLATMEDTRLVPPGSPAEANFRRYVMTETRRRLHQPAFAREVMAAYDVKCAVCTLGCRELLEAAHIIPDRDQLGGDPVVSNGMALCKIHHAAYDRNLLGIRPDYTIEIHQRLLVQVDGPMLTHGLQAHHGKSLAQLPKLAHQLPDRERLEQRYADFRDAA